MVFCKLQEKPVEHEVGVGKGGDREGIIVSLESDPATAVSGSHMQAVEQYKPKCMAHLIKSGSFALRLSLCLRLGKCLGESHTDMRQIWSLA